MMMVLFSFLFVDIIIIIYIIFQIYNIMSKRHIMTVFVRRSSFDTTAIFIINGQIIPGIINI